ncbi:MAG: zinc-binding alcohol dehydrogenase [Candidatus Promineifilaceae bacterium]|nr:zinc-binding alcohol dehydrogenase [Candidatus Promineifilaceae bacterium]
MTDRQALYFLEPHQVEVRKESLPAPGQGQVLVKTAVSAISSGTEMLFYRGQVPQDLAIDSSIAGMESTFSYPLKYGYAAVGRVIALGRDVDKGWLGRRVFSFHPHESYFTTATTHLQPIPDGLPMETAVLLPFMETAVSFLMDGQPVIGEKVAILGQGIVGLLTTALLAGYPLTNLVTLDRFPLRRDWSTRLGAQCALDPHGEETQTRLRSIFEMDSLYSGADLVFELTGNPQVLNQAIALAGYDGRVLIGSWYGKKQAALDLGGQFHRAHIQLISSQVSTIAPRWRGRFDHARRLQTAWSRLAQHQPQRLITHRFVLDQAAEAYRMLDQNPEVAIQVVFTYEDGS